MKRAVRLCVFSNFKYFCTMIFYFSGTGNSHWAATLLGKHLNERIVSISELTETDTTFCFRKRRDCWFRFSCFMVGEYLALYLILCRLLSLRRAIFRIKIAIIPFVLLTAGDSIGRTMERFVSELKEVKLKLH